LILYKLAWEPSPFPGSRSYSAVYPHLNDFTKKIKFCFSSWPTQLRI